MVISSRLCCEQAAGFTACLGGAISLPCEASPGWNFQELTCLHAMILRWSSFPPGVLAWAQVYAARGRPAARGRSASPPSELLQGRRQCNDHDTSCN